MKRILKLAVYGIAAIAALSSCSKNEDVPSQKDIETKIIGKWEQTIKEGKEVLTNNRVIKTFYSNHTATESSSRYLFGVYIWCNKAQFRYEVKGNELTSSFEEPSTKVFSKITSIDETELRINLYKCITPEGKELSENSNATFQKVTADYSQDIIGMWEGVEMTGDETYGDANHRIEYKADGTYTYYDKVGDSWVPSKNAGNEYNVDGDWLATRWQPTEGADYEYEWWDIVEIKDGTMKWSALREKGNGTRYTTTFTWKKVNFPTQEEIETKIIGKWKDIKIDGVDVPTNNKIVQTFETDGSVTQSISRIMFGEHIWTKQLKGIYEVNNSEISLKFSNEQTILTSAVQDINSSSFSWKNFSFIVNGRKLEYEPLIETYQKVTADYSQDIIGMWEGVEMTGDETYGDANHRIEYKADGTYTYYDKVGDSWVPSKNAGNEYNVDGDWLATRWQPTEGADYEYEWWDIDEIKDGTMKWSALREKGDGTRYTTTFTWKKVNLPTQEEIETKIIGKWKEASINGKDALTNNRIVKTFYSNHAETQSNSRYFDGVYVWYNKAPYRYEIKGNELTESPEKSSVMVTSKITAIDETKLCANNVYKRILPDGEEISDNSNFTFHKVTADYSQDIIGMWEGVEMTGDETYGDANHRIYYKEDGTYTYYDKVGDSWVPSKNAGNEYNVDGDWLATRWQPTEGADYEYEWWDIVEIKDGTMKWSALREKGDGTRYTTTFTWKKVNFPTQEEIETKIIGRWKSTQYNDKYVATNDKLVKTFYSNHAETQSSSRHFDGVHVWFNKAPFRYEIKGNELFENSKESSLEMRSKIISIDDTKLYYNVYTGIIPAGEVISRTVDITFQKVTADYSQDIIGMWEGVEMTGDETYGDANHCIEYKADGTYTYYDKEGDNWVPSKNAGNEYNVDGDWLAMRWQPTEGADYEYEWWDIDEIKDGKMKWSALREKGDKTRFITTFTWKKVQLQ